MVAPIVFGHQGFLQIHGQQPSWTPPLELSFYEKSFPGIWGCQPLFGPEITHDLLFSENITHITHISHITYILVILFPSGLDPTIPEVSKHRKEENNEEIAKEGGEMKEVLMLIEPLRSLGLQVSVLGRGWTASPLLWDKHPRRPHTAGMGPEQMTLRKICTGPWRFVCPNGLPGETVSLALHSQAAGGLERSLPPGGDTRAGCHIAEESSAGKPTPNSTGLCREAALSPFKACVLQL